MNLMGCVCAMFGFVMPGIVPQNNLGLVVNFGSFFCAPQGCSVLGLIRSFFLGITSQGAPAERSGDRVPQRVGHCFIACIF